VSDGAAQRRPLGLGPTALGLGPTALALACGLLAAAYGLHCLAVRIGLGTVPHSSRWGEAEPLAALLALLAIALLALLRRADPRCLAGALLAHGLGTSALLELPTSAANFWFGDGPHLGPWLLGGATLLGLYLVGGPRTHSPAARLAVLAVLAATANGRLWSREGDGVFALQAAAVLLLTLELGRAPLRPLTRRARWAVALGACFLLWVIAAALLGEFPGQGLRVASRVAVGALLAYALQRVLDERGRRAVLWALLAGVALALLAAAAGLAEAAAVEGLERVLRSRLRVFDMHPNGIGPLFAVGTVLAIGALLEPRRSGGAARGGMVVLALLCATALFLTQSRASALGAGCGLLAVFVVRFAPLPRSAWPTLAAVVLPPLAALLFLLSPAAAPLLAQLEQATTVNSALGQRVHLWRMALAAIADSPWFGVGPNQYAAHARFARPSFYDGSDQTLHPHNLPLGLAEGAGLPALLLAAALFVVLLEAARRAARRADRAGERGSIAAVTGAVLALLAANQLDLGQSQSTFVPLLFWIGLGWLSSAAGGAPQETRPRRWTAWAVAPAAVLLVLQPLAAAALRDAARVRYERGELDAALELYLDAVRLDPADLSAAPVAAKLSTALGRGELALELRELHASKAPSRAPGWLKLAHEYVQRGQIEAAEVALQRAVAADPRGSSRGDFCVLRAELCLSRSDLAAAEEQLVRAVWLQARPWSDLPLEETAPQPGDGPGARHLAFRAANGQTLALDGVLERVGEELLSSAATDPVAAQRALIPVVQGYRFQQRPQRALHWLRAHGSAVDGRRIPSVVAVELDTLLQLQRPDEVLAVAAELERVHGAAVRDSASFAMRTARARALLGDQGGALAETDRALHLLRGEDVFFVAGEYSALLALHAELLRATGNWPAAARALGRAQRDQREVGPRIELAQEHWRAATDAAAGPEALVAALERLVVPLAAERGARPEKVRAAAMDQRAQRALRAAGGEAERLEALARRRLRSLGSAAREFLAALERARVEGASDGRGTAPGLPTQRLPAAGDD
jgi:O-antigen ligase